MLDVDTSVHISELEAYGCTVRAIALMEVSGLSSVGDVLRKRRPDLIAIPGIADSTAEVIVDACRKYVTEKRDEIRREAGR